MGDRKDKSLSNGKRKAYATITEAIDQMEKTPSWVWDQLETDGATLDSVLDKVEGLSKAQLEKNFPKDEWGDLSQMSKEERRKVVEEKLRDLGINGAWEGQGQYNPKSGQVDLTNFNPYDEVTKAGKPRGNGAMDYSKGFKHLDATLDKMSVDELRKVAKTVFLSGIPKSANHRTIKRLIMSRMATRLGQGDTFFDR